MTVFKVGDWVKVIKKFDQQDDTFDIGDIFEVTKTVSSCGILYCCKSDGDLVSEFEVEKLQDSHAIKTYMPVPSGHDTYGKTIADLHRAIESVRDKNNMLRSEIKALQSMYNDSKLENRIMLDQKNKEIADLEEKLEKKEECIKVLDDSNTCIQKDILTCYEENDKLRAEIKFLKTIIEHLVKGEK